MDWQLFFCLVWIPLLIIAWCVVDFIREGRRLRKDDEPHNWEKDGL